MPFFYDQIKKHLDSLERTFYQLHYAAEIQSGAFSQWKKDRAEPRARRPSDAELQRLASVPWLGIPMETLKAWRAIDEYGDAAIIKAYQTLTQNMPPETQAATIKQAAAQRDLQKSRHSAP